MACARCRTSPSATSDTATSARADEVHASILLFFFRLARTGAGARGFGAIAGAAGAALRGGGTIGVVFIGAEAAAAAGMRLDADEGRGVRPSDVGSGGCGAAGVG